MKSLNQNELKNISGGWVPVVIAIARGVAWVAGVAASACAVAIR